MIGPGRAIPESLQMRVIRIDVHAGRRGGGHDLRISGRAVPLAKEGVEW